MQLEALELVGHPVARSGQEARADPEGARSEPEVQARRLDLVVVEGAAGRQRAGAEQRGDFVIWKDA